MISFAVVDTSSMSNIDRQSDINRNSISYDIDWGTNLDGGTPLVYSGTDTYFTAHSYNLGRIVDDMLYTAPQWLVDNEGNGLSISHNYTDLHILLYNVGIVVY